MATLWSRVVRICIRLQPYHPPSLVAANHAVGSGLVFFKPREEGNSEGRSKQGTALPWFPLLCCLTSAGYRPSCVLSADWQIVISRSPSSFSSRHFTWWPRFRHAFIEFVSVFSRAIRHPWLLQRVQLFSAVMFWFPEGRKYPNIVRDKAWPSFCCFARWRLFTARILLSFPAFVC